MARWHYSSPKDFYTLKWLGMLKTHETWHASQKRCISIVWCGSGMVVKKWLKSGLKKPPLCVSHRFHPDVWTLDGRCIIYRLKKSLLEPYPKPNWKSAILNWICNFSPFTGSVLQQIPPRQLFCSTSNFGRAIQRPLWCWIAKLFRIHLTACMWHGVQFLCFAMKKEVRKCVNGLYMVKSVTNLTCLIRVPPWRHLHANFLSFVKLS